MQVISINKKLDYSAPILFVPYSAEATKGRPITNKPTAVKLTTPQVAATKATPNKTTPAAAVVKKPTTIATAIKTTPKKSEVKTTPVAPYSAKATKGTSAEAEVKKVEPKKIQEIEQKLVEPAPSLAKALDIEAAIIPVQQETPQAGVPVQNTMEHGVKKLGVKDNAIVSNNYREVEALRRGAQLQKELVHKWHPPIGVSPDCTCEISFFVNNKGTIENLKMVKGSGVMMFDISARQALFAMKMPQWTYGNPLTISFKQ